MSANFFAYDDDGDCDRAPEPGVRVRFDPDKMLAKRPDRPLRGDEGLVVDHVATGVLRWPASLWRVDDLEQVTERGPLWSRCKAFTVVEQVPAWLVAGPRGYAVEWVIALCRELTAEQVEALAAMPGDEERPLALRLWKAWSAENGGGSPVGSSLGLVFAAIDQAARRVGDHLFGWDEEDGVEILMDPTWRDAAHAAYSAALGLGAPDWLTPEENAALTRRWTTMFGSV